MPDDTDDQPVVDVQQVGEGTGPLPEDFDLLKHGKEHARESLEGLEDPEEDILPVLLTTGPYGMSVMPLLGMGDDDQKDALAQMMTTLLAVSRATQAVLITTGWMVAAKSAEGDKHLLDVMPSQHPDRVETITAMYMTDGSKPETMAHAVITRHKDKPPKLGPWTNNLAGLDADDKPVSIGGRFGDAVHMGFNFVAGMPPQLVELIDAGWAANEQEDLIKRFHNVFTQFVADMEAASAEGASDGK
jgi:hypothetical protein